MGDDDGDGSLDPPCFYNAFVTSRLYEGPSKNDVFMAFQDVQQDHNDSNNGGRL